MSGSEGAFFRIVRGVPTAEELAALVGALATRRVPSPPARQDSSLWASRSRPAGLPARRGKGAWRASGLPR